MKKVSGLAVVLFFLKHRFLPIYDMVSDVLVAAEVCGGSDNTIENLNTLFSATCTFGDEATADTQRIFFWLIVAFFFATWAVLWLALSQHVVTLARERKESGEKDVKSAPLGVGLVMSAGEGAGEPESCWRALPMPSFSLPSGRRSPCLGLVQPALAASPCLASILERDPYP